MTLPRVQPLNTPILCFKGLLMSCNQMSADYLFMQDKLYDIRYDTGDKVIQCGRHNDIFKLWLQWRAKVRIITDFVIFFSAHLIFIQKDVYVILRFFCGVDKNCSDRLKTILFLKSDRSFPVYYDTLEQNVAKKFYRVHIFPTPCNITLVVCC